MVGTTLVYWFGYATTGALSPEPLMTLYNHLRDVGHKTCLTDIMRWASRIALGRVEGKEVVFFFGARVFSYLCYKPEACMQYE